MLVIEPNQWNKAISFDKKEKKKKAKVSTKKSANVEVRRNALN